MQQGIWLLRTNLSVLYHLKTEELPMLASSTWRNKTLGYIALMGVPPKVQSMFVSSS